MDATANERWLPIPGHEGYEASDIGRVRSVDRTLVHKNGRLQRRKGVMLKQRQDQDGYWRCRCGLGIPLGVHRLVLMAFVGPCPPGMLGLHNNGDPSDSRLENLRWGTPSDNTADMFRHGRNANVNKTHCSRNHPLSGDNVNPSARRAGVRTCRACAKAAARIYRFRRQGRPEPDMQAESDLMLAEILAGFGNGNTLRGFKAAGLMPPSLSVDQGQPVPTQQALWLPTTAAPVRDSRGRGAA